MINKDKKILLVTFSRNANYGGALQEFALYAYLKDRYAVECLDYVNPAIRANSRVIRTAIFYAVGIVAKRLFVKRKTINEVAESEPVKSKQGSISYYIRDGLNLLRVFFSDILNYKNRKQQIEAYRFFWQKFITYSKSYTEKELFSSPPLEFDVYIAGSDQIWNPVKFGLSKVYYLCFAPAKVCKISYAPSYANFHFTNDGQSKLILEYLKSFSAVSVREEHSRQELNALGVSAMHVLDPTLLLTKEDWLNTLGIKTPKPEKPYLLAYAMNDHTKVYEYAAKIGEKHSLDVKIIGNPRKQVTYSGIEYLPSVGPDEFVELFLGASFVVCNSFHGTAFSVNFNIPFVCLDSNLPERINSLLNLVGLTSRQGSFKDESVTADDWDTHVDFNYANQVMAQERKQSAEYLESAINTPQHSGLSRE